MGEEGLANYRTAPRTEAVLDSAMDRVVWNGLGSTQRSQNCDLNNHKSKARRSAASASAMRREGSTPTSGVTNRDGSSDRTWRQRNTVSRGNPDSAAASRTFTGLSREMSAASVPTTTVTTSGRRLIASLGNKQDRPVSDGIERREVNLAAPNHSRGHPFRWRRSPWQ